MLPAKRLLMQAYRLSYAPVEGETYAGNLGNGRSPSYRGEQDDDRYANLGLE